jgi:hypothetical protein
MTVDDRICLQNMGLCRLQNDALSNKMTGSDGVGLILKSVCQSAVITVISVRLALERRHISNELTYSLRLHDGENTGHDRVNVLLCHVSECICKGVSCYLIHEYPPMVTGFTLQNEYTWPMAKKGYTRDEGTVNIVSYTGFNFMIFAVYEG